MKLQLRLTLLSDATFGQGSSTMGAVDTEVAHDDDGLPYLGGRALKGLLVEECAHGLYHLRRHRLAEPLQAAALWLFGQPGSKEADEGLLRFGDAQLPEPLREAIRTELESGRLRREEVLEMLTGIRRQTAVDEATGTPVEHTLRAERVVLRGTYFTAALDYEGKPPIYALPLLADCVAALRRAGTGRRRGRGRLQATLLSEKGASLSNEWLQEYAAAVLGQVEP